MAFPGLIRAIVMLQCVVFVIILLKPETDSQFLVTPEGIANGEYWRLISWVIYPFVSPGFGILSALFMFIILRIAFLFNDSLENAWGEVRTSIYVYAIIICQSVCLYLSAIGFFGAPIAFGNQMFYLAIFFAFATTFPHVEFLLFFVLPVKVWVFALISAAGILFSCFVEPILILAYGLAYFPYLYWAIPKAWHWRKYRSQLTARRIKFQSKAMGGQAQSLHSCQVCQRTEGSDPDLEFRVAENGKEYCLDHLDKDGKPLA